MFPDSGQLPPDRIPSIRVLAMPADTNAAGDIFGGWLIRYVSPVFAYFKLFSFAVLQISMAFMILVIIIYLFGNSKNYYGTNRY